MFLTNVPRATFIPGATSIPESRVGNGPVLKSSRTCNGSSRDSTKAW